MSEARRQLTIVNKRGLHARASAKLVGEVSKLDPEIEVRIAKGGHEAAGNSILGLMMLGAGQGDQVELIVRGAPSDDIIHSLSALIEDGFGEE